MVIGSPCYFPRLFNLKWPLGAAIRSKPEWLSSAAEGIYHDAKAGEFNFQADRMNRLAFTGSESEICWSAS